MTDILISYAREDRAVAEVLAGFLSSAGYSVWWDRDLLSGVDYEQEIQTQLATARAVIVIWSAASTKSGWVRDEASAAMQRGVLVPVNLWGTAPPLGFRSLHTIALDPQDPVQLLKAVTRLISTPAHPPALAPPPRPPSGLGTFELVFFGLLALAFAFLVHRIIS